jgi:hypothetical protein
MWRVLIFFPLAILLFVAQPGNAMVDHSKWDGLLKKYVDDQGRVAYRDLKAQDQQSLQSYLDLLAEADIKGMNAAEEKAFWINAYNAAVVSGVLQGYTAENFLARKQFFSWYSLLVAGAERSPDDIEHKILRKKFDDPRIHFAIVCASTSCPKLRREAYVADRLDQQLDEAAQEFINDPTRNRIDRREVALSMIFQWFAGDFIKEAGSVSQLVQRFVGAEKKGLLQARTDDLGYLAYDWTLNAQEGQRIS